MTSPAVNGRLATALYVQWGHEMESLYLRACDAAGRAYMTKWDWRMLESALRHVQVLDLLIEAARVEMVAFARQRLEA